MSDRRTLLKRALAALASVPVVSRLWASDKPKWLVTSTHYTLSRASGLIPYHLTVKYNDAAFMRRLGITKEELRKAQEAFRRQPE